MEESVVSGSYLPHDVSLMTSWIALQARAQPLGIVMVFLLCRVPWTMKKKMVRRPGWCVETPETEEKRNLGTKLGVNLGHKGPLGLGGFLVAGLLQGFYCFVNHV